MTRFLEILLVWDFWFLWDLCGRSCSLAPVLDLGWILVGLPVVERSEVWVNSGVLRHAKNNYFTLNLEMTSYLPYLDLVTDFRIISVHGRKLWLLIISFNIVTFEAHLWGPIFKWKSICETPTTPPPPPKTNRLQHTSARRAGAGGPRAAARTRSGCWRTAPCSWKIFFLMYYSLRQKVHDIIHSQNCHRSLILDTNSMNISCRLPGTGVVEAVLQARPHRCLHAGGHGLLQSSY